MRRCAATGLQSLGAATGSFKAPKYGRIRVLPWGNQAGGCGTRRGTAPVAVCLTPPTIPFRMEKRVQMDPRACRAGKA
jgi:hypothetical protein